MTFGGTGRAVALITGGTAAALDFETTSAAILEIVRIAAEERVRYVQLREKQLPARLLFHLTCSAVRLTAGTGTLILVNDRADIALAAGAAGVHLTERSIPADVIRKCFPPSFIIGVSTHSAEATVGARRMGANLAVFGPVFKTPGKGPPQGVSELARVCRLAGDFPVLGIGGIDETNFADVLGAGAAGFAAIRALNDAGRLRSLSHKFGK